MSKTREKNYWFEMIIDTRSPFATAPCIDSPVFFHGFATFRTDAKCVAQTPRIQEHSEEDQENRPSIDQIDRIWPMSERINPQKKQYNFSCLILTENNFN